MSALKSTGSCLSKMPKKKLNAGALRATATDRIARYDLTPEEFEEMYKPETLL